MSRVLRLVRLLTLVVSLGGTSFVFAQEASRTLERTYKLDEKGDAQIEWDFQLGASQWGQWKDEFGDHPDMMLRDVKYQLAASVIDDFSLDKDDVHRRGVTKIKARCLAKYLGNGQFALQVPKDMKLVAGSGTDWAFTSSAVENGGLVNITDRAKLPAKAQNAHLVTGNDYDQLVYSLDVEPARPKALLFLGALLLFAAVVFGVLSLFVGRTPAARATPPPLPT